MIVQVAIFLSILASQSVAAELQTVSVDVPLGPLDPNAVLLNAPLINPRGRIINGNAAVDGQFPHLNEVRLTKTGGYVLCTGTFLTTSYAITARHCLHDDPEWKPIHVLYGSAARNSPIRQSVGVNSFTVWNSGDDRLDMAVLRFERTIQLNQYVGLAQLPPLSMEHSHYEGYTATQAGHGAFKDLQYHQIRMQYVRDGCLNLNSPGDRWGICAKPLVCEIFVISIEF